MPGLSPGFKLKSKTRFELMSRRPVCVCGGGGGSGEYVINSPAENFLLFKAAVGSTERSSYEALWLLPTLREN